MIILGKKVNIFYVGLIIFMISNLLLLNTFELSFDEAYYWIYSEYMDWGYYDHPPMVAVFIKIGTQIFGNNEFGVRVVFSLVNALTLFLAWKIIDKDNKLIFWCILLGMPLLNFSAILALPDTTLLFFVVVFFYAIKRYLAEDSFVNVLLVSLSITAMFYSKYHGLIIVLLTVCGNLAFLKRKSFYLIAILVVVLFSPHVIWQYNHDFISFLFHLTGRVEKHFEISNILNFLLSQIALMGFFTFFAFFWFYKEIDIKDKFNRILVFNSFGFLVFLLLLSFRNQVEANWSISSSVAFLILMSKSLKIEKKKTIAITSIFAVIVGFGLKIMLLNLSEFDDKTVKDNRIYEIYGWKDQIIPKVKSECGDKMIVGDNYQVTAKISFYLKREIAAIHLNSRESQYSILNLQKNIPKDKSICFLTSNPKQHSVKIETYYKDPIYLVKNTTLGELAKLRDTTYEKIIRTTDK